MSETNKGWVKIHRQLMSKGFYKNSDYIHLWLHLLLKANHSSNEFLHGNSVIKLKAGQFVTGRKSLSNETGIHESKVQRILKCFENEQQIKQQTNRQYRVITILSWDKFQHSEQQDEQQMNNKRTTVERRLNTNKNEKNEKNKKKGFLPSVNDGLSPEFYHQSPEEFEKQKQSLNELGKKYRKDPFEDLYKPHGNVNKFPMVI